MDEYGRHTVIFIPKLYISAYETDILKDILKFSPEIKIYWINKSIDNIILHGTWIQNAKY